MSGAEVIERLSRRFGVGEPGTIRAKLYLKLAEIIELEGDPAYMVIAGAAADAAGKEQPDRYFSKVVIARLREKGFLATPEL